MDYLRVKVLITAGPTRERIDPVRFLSNYSTGKMGYSIAEAAVQRGAQVILISGPTQISPPQGCQLECVESALEMFEMVKKYYEDVDVIIKTAAVADYRPATVHSEKIKKSDEDLCLTLVRNPDIAKYLGHNKKKQLLIGFAAESQDELNYGYKKLSAKNFDMICINNIKSSEIGFGSDLNEMILLKKNQEEIFLPRTSKYEIANQILDEIKTLR